MNQSKINKGALILGSALALCLGANAAQARDPIRITKLTLFSAQTGPDTSVMQIEQDGVIPYRVEDSCYGWYMEFEPVDGAVVLEEVLSIPAPAPQWNTDGESTVADDRKSASTTLRFDGRDGTAQHGWCVVEGDPAGAYSFSIAEDGAPVGVQLRFRLERP